ncbi:hypothetical protein HELRODRAFT_165895 [Helobdella robusta]|uniref:Uncharacterized protein n=1 Tax=Helobdella robusta TaxID=6412 RepID=T1EXE9_HELRO|nr:hypothetical protein HELRODRAFT_165895 [Helobdella robusta]ESN91814.1 hypothetical protein HELRODRAFT_165895 [Helobdella robusta]
MALILRIVPTLLLVLQALCILPRTLSYPARAYDQDDDDLEMQKKYFLEPFGDSLLDKRSSYRGLYPSQLDNVRYQSEPYEVAYSGKYGHFDGSRHQKRYFLEPFGDSLLDKRSNYRMYENVPLVKPAKVDSRKKHLDFYINDDVVQKRYFLEPFGDSLLDKRSSGHKFESSSLASENLKSTNGKKEKSVINE